MRAIGSREIWNKTFLAENYCTQTVMTNISQWDHPLSIDNAVSLILKKLYKGTIITADTKMTKIAFVDRVSSVFVGIIKNDKKKNKSNFLYNADKILI